MAQNYDLTQTGPELQARVDQVFPNRDAIEQETVTREAQDESLETSLKAYTDTEQARAEEVEGALDTRVSANEEDIELLQSEYAALTQSDIIVGPLPSTGQPNKIYRVPGSTYYTDYMWANGGWVKLAEYSTLDGYVYKGIATPSGTPVQSAEAVFYFAVQPGTYTNYGGLVVTDTIAILKYNGTNWTKDDVITIDDEPTAGSENLVTSGALAASVVYDISAANAVGGQLATYADLAAALNGGANVPVELRKGGMSIKFVQTSDNKYVQYRLMNTSFSTDEEDWIYENDGFKGITDNTALNDFLRELYISPSVNITQIDNIEIDNSGNIFLRNDVQNIIVLENDGTGFCKTSYAYAENFGYAIVNKPVQGIYDVRLDSRIQNLKYCPSLCNSLILYGDELNNVVITRNIGSQVNINGQLVSDSNKFYSDPIQVNKGDIIKVLGTGNSQTAIISYTDSLLSTFELVKPYNGTDNSEYFMVSDRDGYICISGHNSFISWCRIINSETVREVLNTIKNIENVTVSVDDQIGTPSGTASFQNGVLAFDFHNLRGQNGQNGERGPQGLQGNSGYTGAAGELEIVNNITDGGATKALSAEQGKIIGNYIDYNNIPITPKYVNPDSIATIKAEPSNWTNLDADGTVSQSKVDIFDEVYSIYRDCVELNDNNSGRFAASFPSAIDFSNNVLRMSVCLQKDLDVTKLQTFAVLLYSDGQTDANHRAQFTEQYAKPSEGGGTYNQQYARGGWFHFCVNPQPLLYSIGGSFDITNVTAVGIHAYSQESIKVYVDEVSVVRTMLQKGIINIVDNFDTNVPNMADYAFSKGVKLNLSIVPNWIGGSASASLAEINRCKRQGHFIFNHTFNHITDVSELTEQQIVEEITKGNSWMVSNGFARGAKCISNPSAAFPLSKYKAYMESPAEIIYHHWTTMESGLVYYPYYPMSRLLSISALDNNSTTYEQAQATLQRMKVAIDTAEAYGGIAVIGSHGTFWSADNGDTWKELIDYIATKTDMISFGIDDIVEGNFV